MPKLFALNFRSGLLIGFAVAIAVAAAAIAYERYDTRTLKRTLRRDAVLCGVNTGLPGFSSADEKGNWSGCDLRRSDQGQIRPARRQRTVHGATEAQGGCALAQHDVESVARNQLRPAFRRGLILRRPRVHGAQGT